MQRNKKSVAYMQEINNRNFGKEFKSAISIMFKQLEATMCKELKGSRTESHPIENIYKE